MSLPSRRHILIGAAGLGALASSACSAPSDSAPRDALLKTKPERRTYVLVHGAWHGGWCWKYVRERLEAAGHRVFTPTLTGLGEREHLMKRDVNLTTHATDIVNLFKFEELEEVILVGHSYAGYIISLVADTVPDKISQLIYLDASLPKIGKAFFSKEQRSIYENKYEAYNMPPAGLKFLGIPEDHKHASWVLSHLTPHPLGTFFEPVAYQNSGIKGLSKTFIRCMKTRRYNNGDDVKEMTEKDPEWRYLLIDTGHDAMVTAPAELSDMLLNTQ